MTLVWILGGSGLLGTALHKELIQPENIIFSTKEKFDWTSEKRLFVQLSNAVHAFALAAEKADSWEIYWAAGIGTMGSTESELLPETKALEELLRLIKHEPGLLINPGRFGFASSAGAIYAGSRDYLISEDSLPAPVSAYGYEKLRQEKILEAFSNHQISVLCARISTLYGLSKAQEKKQGLISYIARNIVMNKAVHIYVPLDTIRDYVTADNAARNMIAALRLNNRNSFFTIKIIASEQPASIAKIISYFKMIAHRAPRIITSTNKLSQLYTRCVRYKSVVEPVHKTYVNTGLLLGIKQVMDYEIKLQLGHTVDYQKSR
jgi:UDP-glucose 4-epimerase